MTRPDPLRAETVQKAMAYAVVAAKGFEDFSPWASEYQAADAMLAALTASGWTLVRSEELAGLDRAAKTMRVPVGVIRTALANLRGPVTRDESIVMACADAVAWSMERAALEAKGPRP